jgi:DNA replication protein
MKKFGGFPVRTEFVPVPAIFFSVLLPQIDDSAELKVTLHIFRLLYPRKGYPRHVTQTELIRDVNVLSSLRGYDKPPEEVLKQALGKMVERGTVLTAAAGKDGSTENIYLLNTESDREALEKIRNGEIKLQGLDAKTVAPEAVAQLRPNVYTLYEENIGLLTPMIAEELKDAEKNYPEQWIDDAIKEAVKANKRNWRYVARLLERWATEGKNDGAYQRDTKKTDPDKYTKGLYGDIVEH